MWQNTGSPEKRNNAKTVLVAAAIFAFMFALNHFMPIHRDDYDYAMIWKTGVPIASLSDVLTSAVQHYLLHGGRMVTVFCLDLFLWLGKLPFDAANALMFLVLVLLVAMHARRALVLSPGVPAAAALLLWLCLPHFGEVAVWKSGSTVYLWSAVPALLFLLPYNLCLKSLGTGRRERHTKAVLPMFLLGVLAGWSLENLAVTVVGTALGASLYAVRRYAFLPPWMAAGAFGALLGLIGLIAAPGNYVRYDVQGAGKGILVHMGNQIAGQGEMALYLLPVLLLILTAWRLYRRSLARMEAPPVSRPGWGTLVLAVVLVLLVLSYVTGGWVASAIRDAVIAHGMPLLGIAKPKTIHLFTNVMNGFEEMAIYWFAILLFYARLTQVLGLTSVSVRRAAERVPARAVFCAYPAARYAAFLMGLAVCDNLVMLAAPTFPGRATFSAAVLFVAAALALLFDAPIRAALLPQAGHVLCTAAFALFAFTGTAALIITHEMAVEDAWRIARIEEARVHGETVVHFPRIARTNRALRHVYYEDWDNNVTKDGAMEYFGLTGIVVEPQ